MILKTLVLYVLVFNLLVYNFFIGFSFYNYIQKDIKENESSKNKIEYYQCQVHLRMMPDEINNNNAEVKKVIEETIQPDSSSSIIKRHLDEINKQVLK